MDWDVIVGELGPRLYRYFLGAFAADQADELAQEVLVRLVRRWQEGGFNQARGNMAMWAFGIAHNVRREAYRNGLRQGRHDGIELLDTLPAGGSAKDPYDIMALRKAIEKLPESERDVVLLHIDQELTLSEIAELLRLPIGTVKSHIHRAKANMKNFLKEDVV